MDEDQSNQDHPHDVPTPSESVAALQRLLAMWHAHDGEAAIPHIDGTPLPGVAIHVQVEHIAELTASVIALLRQNIYLSTAPLIRLSMECAVNAVWWARNPMGVRSSMHEAARQSSLLVRAMRRMSPGAFRNSGVVDEVVRDYARFASDEARVFELRCKAIPGGEWIYPYYRLLSQASHGGPPLLEEYMEPIPPTAENPDGISLVQRPHYHQLEIALGTQVIIFALAIAAWDSVLPSHPGEKALYELGDRLGFGDMLRQATGRNSAGKRR